MFWYQFFCNFDGGYLFDYVSPSPTSHEPD